MCIRIIAALSTTALSHRNHAYVGASYDSYGLSRQHKKEHTVYRFSYKDFLLLDV